MTAPIGLLDRRAEATPDDREIVALGVTCRREMPDRYGRRAWRGYVVEGTWATVTHCPGDGSMEWQVSFHYHDAVAVGVVIAGFGGTLAEAHEDVRAKLRGLVLALGAVSL